MGKYNLNIRTNALVKIKTFEFINRNYSIHKATIILSFQKIKFLNKLSKCLILSLT